jgi:hypothetical protein
LQINILKSFLNCRGCGSRMHLKKNKRKLNDKEYVLPIEVEKRPKIFMMGLFVLFRELKYEKS